MTTYRHTQRGMLIIVVMLGLSILFLVLGLYVLRPLIAAVPLLLVSGWLFNSLTIEIVNRELRWRFGPGLVRRTVALEDIASAKAVRTNVIEGWGIHLSRFGWLHNVSGFHAVAIELKSGKRFALGTDEPNALQAAIRSALTAHE
jgi:hypothetical protein